MIEMNTLYHHVTHLLTIHWLKNFSTQAGVCDFMIMPIGKNTLTVAGY